MQTFEVNVTFHHFLCNLVTVPDTNFSTFSCLFITDTVLSRLLDISAHIFSLDYNVDSELYNL